jgi:Sortase and related acyltransferases
MLLATADGCHIGNCSLSDAGPFKRYQHRCQIAIALYQKYWGCGIGQMMLSTILSVARELGYEQAELEVAANNTSAIALYKKLGFQTYGTFPDNMKYADGSYTDMLWMMKKLI